MKPKDGQLERFATVMFTLQAIKEIKAYNKENQFVEFFRMLPKRWHFFIPVSLSQQLPSMVWQTIVPSIVASLLLYFRF